jgi:hypothetical protein
VSVSAQEELAPLERTKTRRYLKTDLPLARRRALWVSRRLDGHWVTPVICLVDADRRPYRDDRVWVVSGGDLREWLEARRERPVDLVFALRSL